MHENQLIFIYVYIYTLNTIGINNIAVPPLSYYFASSYVNERACRIFLFSTHPTDRYILIRPQSPHIGDYLRRSTIVAEL